MEPEYLIAGPDALRLQVAARVEPFNVLGPCVPALDAGDERLADAEPLGDFLLHHTLRDKGEDFGVAPVQIIHAGSLPGDDVERAFQLLSLDDGVGTQAQQKPLHVGSVGDSEAEQPPVTLLCAASVFFDPTVAEPRVDRVQHGLVGVRETKADAAFILVDFDAAFSVEKARDIAQKGIFGPVFHGLDVARRYKLSMPELAVPCIAWILERMRLSMEAAE